MGRNPAPALRIMPTMRVLWIALLIALLPLRGWVGDAMALSMAAAPLAATAVAAPAAHAEPASAHGDTHGGHGEHAEHAAPASHDGDHDSHSAHLLCEVCNGPVLSTAPPAVAIAPIEHSVLVERQQRFASLAPRQLIKPPIS